MIGYVKQAIVILASAFAGFYVGGRYVGSLVQTEYRLAKPNWMVQAQETMWLALGAMTILVLVWLFLDYRSTDAAFDLEPNQ